MKNNWIIYGKTMNDVDHWVKTCYICNQWILKGEEFYVVGVPREINKNNTLNFIVHKDEWEKFQEGLSDEELYEKILAHKKPRKNKLTLEQLEKIELFKKACSFYGYDKCVISKDKRFVRVGKRKTSVVLTYDIIFEVFSYNTRASKGLFDGLFVGDLVAKVQNKFYEYAGYDKRNNYSSSDIINKAIDEANKMIGK